jgi:hypothetical protein
MLMPLPAIGQSPPYRGVGPFFRILRRWYEAGTGTPVRDP